MPDGYIATDLCIERKIDACRIGERSAVFHGSFAHTVLEDRFGRCQLDARIYANDFFDTRFDNCTMFIVCAGKPDEVGEVIFPFCILGIDII